jgi:hypothetical protein
MEEPENGIHPERIPAMIQLLRDLTTDIQESEPVGSGNPLRQVIINTHSPSVVMQVPDDSLIMAEPVELNQNGRFFKALQLRCLPDTWRDRMGHSKPISKGQLLAYLNPVARGQEDLWAERTLDPQATRDRSRRVIDRQDLRQYKIEFSEIAK